MKRTAPVLFLLAAILSSLPDLGCRSNPEHALRLIVAIDASDQTEEHLIRYVGLAYESERRLPASSSITVFAFGHQTQVLYRGPVIKGRGQFGEATLLPLSKKENGISRPGTRTDLLFGALVTEVRAGEAPTAVVVLTDGGMEDQSAAALHRLNKAVLDLSHEPKLKSIRLAGIDQQYRLFWEGWLRPLKSKASVLGMNDADASITATTDGGGSR